MTLQVPTVDEAAKNPQMAEVFISNHEHFILSCASKCSGRFISKEDDEWAISLEAFYKAIRRYDNTKGAFFPFANLIIRNSLVDHYRGDKNQTMEILTDHFDENTSENTIGPDIRLEIDALGHTLMEYGIAFSDLVASSPKAVKTRFACQAAVTQLLLNPEWMKELRRTKLLPIGLIQKKTEIPRKILERHRKYIIAVVEILDGDYYCLAEYVRQPKEVER